MHIDEVDSAEVLVVLVLQLQFIDSRIEESQRGVLKLDIDLACRFGHGVGHVDLICLVVRTIGGDIYIVSVAREWVLGDSERGVKRLDLIPRCHLGDVEHSVLALVGTGLEIGAYIAAIDIICLVLAVEL